MEAVAQVREQAGTMSPKLQQALGRVYAFLMTLPDAKIPEATAAKQATSGGTRVGASLEKARRRG